MTLPAVTLESAEPRVQELLGKTKKQIGMIPNMYTRMAIVPGLLESYQLGYERLRKESGFTPAEQEVVFLSISFENGCEYCMAAHSVVADTASKVPRTVTDAIRIGATIPDPKLSALSSFARTLVVKRGRPAPEDVQAFLAAGYTERQVLEIVLAIAVKTISNYTNHLFGTPVDAVFEGRTWSAPASAHPEPRGRECELTKQGPTACAQL
jgi:uncharacterized peroxidase-related enzyme